MIVLMFAQYYQCIVSCALVKFYKSVICWQCNPFQY